MGILDCHSVCRFGCGYPPGFSQECYLVCVWCGEKLFSKTFLGLFDQFSYQFNKPIHRSLISESECLLN